jgi:hypothetical protein
MMVAKNKLGDEEVINLFNQYKEELGKFKNKQTTEKPVWMVDLEKRYNLN